MTELDSFLAWIGEREKLAAKNKNIVGSLAYAFFGDMLKRMIEEYRKVEAEWLKT
jgi:hypothetical protein